LQNTCLEERVLRPLQQLLDTLTGPARLIQKRNDKLLDYAAASQRQRADAAVTAAAAGQRGDSSKARDLARVTRTVRKQKHA
jgi:hypothetical protein